MSSTKIMLHKSTMDKTIKTEHVKRAQRTITYSLNYKFFIKLNKEALN